MGWVMLFSWPLMCGIQEISARIGRVTGQGVAGNLKRHYPVSVVYGFVSLLVVANVINIGADLGAMGAALKLLIGGPALIYVALFGLASVLLEVFSQCSRYVSVLKWLTLSLFAYVGVAIMEEYKGAVALDAGLISSAQAVEHYEIARYGTLVAWAKQLGVNAAVPLLQLNLGEEEATDRKLTQLAQTSANAKGKKAA